MTTNSYELLYIIHVCLFIVGKADSGCHKNSKFMYNTKMDWLAFVMIGHENIVTRFHYAI